MNDREGLLGRVREILLTKWDPIRLQELPEDVRNANQDEYDRYAEAIVAMLMDGRDEDALENYLSEVEIRKMGQKPRDGRAGDAARALFSMEELSQPH
jgi:hypothetical protein